GKEDVRWMGKNLGVIVENLADGEEKPAFAAKGWKKLLLGFSVDRGFLNKRVPAVMRDLQRLCIVCGQKGRCQHELAQGTAADHFREFCPNAYTLDALFNQKVRPSRH